MRLAPMTLPLLLGLCACADRETPPVPSAQDTPSQDVPSQDTLSQTTPAQNAPARSQPAQSQAATQPASMPESPPSSSTPASAPAAPPAEQQDVPARFRGRYSGNTAACTQSGEETALDIQARRIEFHESTGEVVAARTEGDAIAIDAQMSGEGKTGSARIASAWRPTTWRWSMPKAACAVFVAPPVDAHAQTNRPSPLAA